MEDQTEEEGALGKGRGRTPPAEEERWAWKRVGVFRGDKKSGLERREAGGHVQKAFQSWRESEGGSRTRHASCDKHTQGDQIQTRNAGAGAAGREGLGRRV